MDNFGWKIINYVNNKEENATRLKFPAEFSQLRDSRCCKDCRR
jgi:hypothetical protein